jgi:RNA polymerase sigma factor
MSECLSLEPEELIDRLRDGETEIREYLIKTYWEYIRSIVSRMTGRIADSTDEFSVALEAFNEAIDDFDITKNPSFLGFAGLVINRRVIDYFRRTRRFGVEYPFSSLADEDRDEDYEPAGVNPPALLTERFEIQDEILSYRKSLAGFGISFEDLVQSAPKHADTRAMCAAIAKELCDDRKLSARLNEDGRLPIAGLLPGFSLSRKTLEKNRKYIIALYLIMKSDMEILKGYIESYIKGADAR